MSAEALQEVVSKVLSTLWSTASFQALYGRLSDWTPGSDDAQPTMMDRWALSHACDGPRRGRRSGRFDSQTAGRLIAELIDDLSNWYVRRSRRRFWEGEPAALQTLHTCLRSVVLMMAGFTPFITERLWQDLSQTLKGWKASTWRRGRRWTSQRSTGSSRTGWPWCADWWSSVARPARSPA